jgi:cytochrome P450
MDVVKDLAYPLPANVIAEMLGMPTSVRELLQAWSKDILAIFQAADIIRLRRCQRSVLEMQDYLRALVAERRHQPREDVLSMFVAAEKEGNVTEDEIVANCVLLLFAGHETTAGLIANGLLLLLGNPAQLALLKPNLTPSAVEEMLRCDGPASLIVRRSTEAVELWGHSFPAGTEFYLSTAAGNRDPEVFVDPDRFDITRTNSRHTAFGMGAFYCLGAALARMESDECLRILLDRFPDVAPAYLTPDWSPVPPLAHRLESLRVTF